MTSGEGARAARMESGLDAAATGGRKPWAGMAVKWIMIGTVLQVAMVITGHYVVSVANVFGILGTLIALVVGLLYAMDARISWGNAALGGALCGGLSALLGIVVSWLLGDVLASILLLGTVSGLVAGGIGGLIGHGVAGRRR